MLRVSEIPYPRRSPSTQIPWRKSPCPSHSDTTCSSNVYLRSLLRDLILCGDVLRCHRVLVVHANKFFMRPARCCRRWRESSTKSITMTSHRTLQLFVSLLALTFVTCCSLACLVRFLCLCSLEDPHQALCALVGGGFYVFVVSGILQDIARHHRHYIGQVRFQDIDLPRKVHHGSSDETDCAVCLETFRCGDIVSHGASCEHQFHHTCLLEWSKHQCYDDSRSTITCPCCRMDLLQKHGPPSPRHSLVKRSSLSGRRRISFLHGL